MNNKYSGTYIKETVFVVGGFGVCEMVGTQGVANHDGSWEDRSPSTRSAQRIRVSSEYLNGLFLGFRVVRELDYFRGYPRRARNIPSGSWNEIVPANPRLYSPAPTSDCFSIPIVS